MRAWLLVAALVLSGCASTRMPDPVQAALDRAGLPAESLGFVLQPLDGSRQALARRQRAGAPPAPAPLRQRAQHSPGRAEWPGRREE